MHPSREFLYKASSETGFQPEVLEKVVLLGDLAGDISRHPLLKDSLLLKGGTALNLGFGSPDRLSVDLDYNYVGRLDRESMLQDRPRCEEAVCDLSKRKGYQVQRSADSFAGRKIYCTYQSISGPDDRIEVDLNFVYRLPLEKPEYRKLWQPGEYEKPQILMVSKTELLIGKLLALIDRAAVRDIWDVGRLPEIVPEMLESERFRAMFIVLSAVLDHPLYEYSVDRIRDKVSPRLIQRDLLPLLRIGSRVSVHEVLDQAYVVLAPLLELTGFEREYIDKVSEGVLDPGLVIKDREEASRLAEHPALIWKIMNVRRKKPGNG